MNELRNAAMTVRCHTVRTLKPQTLAEHSYHVAMLCWKLCDREPSAELLKAAMFHDLAESRTGDIPATAKWESAMLREALQLMEDNFESEHHLYCSLTPKEMLVLKWADALELAWHCVDEMRMGNRFVDQMYDNIMQYMLKLEPVKNSGQEYNKVRSAYAIANTR